MSDVWEQAFAKNQMMWGPSPSHSAVLAEELFSEHGATSVLIPGAGYGRNALPFLDAGMAVVGIEISETAIALARSQMGLELPIHQGSVTDMPFDDRLYDGIFCFGLLYLLDADSRAKLLRDCYAQLAPGGWMVFTLIAKSAPMYGKGTELAPDWFETHPGIRLYFYDADSIAREFGEVGLVAVTEVAEPSAGGKTLPFLHVTCQRPR